MHKVTVVSRKTTVYTRAHVPTEVTYTPRIKELIDAGVFKVVGGGVERDSVISKSELIAKAAEAGVTVRSNWSKSRIQEAINEGNRKAEPSSNESPSESKWPSGEGS